ncbi:hypothetical protein SLS56_010829 [Neofusicoccum ribis]|uniref:Uncharacterized protein n=1 Tax=Neofusicoccum ribis TaxID=45134 RepID=A0ABR3SDA6_9PEZI
MPRTRASTAATERGTQTPTNSSPKELANASSHKRSFTRNGSMQARKANGRFGRKIKSKEELENQELKANAVEIKAGVCSANTEHRMMAMAATPDETRPSEKRKKSTLSASIKDNTLNLERLSTIMSERVRKTDEAREGDAISERMTKSSVDGRLPGPILRTTPGPPLSGKRIYPVCTSTTGEPADCIKDGNQNESLGRLIEYPPKSPLFTIDKDNAGSDKEIQLPNANKEKADSMDNAIRFSDPLVKIATVRTEHVDMELCENAQTQDGPNPPLTQTPAQAVVPGTQAKYHDMGTTPTASDTSARRNHKSRRCVPASNRPDHGLESEASLWKQFFNFDSSTDEE